MRDTTRLRRRIEHLIGIATMAVGTTACDRSDTTTQAGPDPTVTTKTKTTATETPSESVTVPTALTAPVPTNPLGLSPPAADVRRGTGAERRAT
jgi:hypothetical protein